MTRAGIFANVAAVTKGDTKAEIINKMVRGMPASYNDAYDAEDALRNFVKLVASIPGEFNSYGVGVIINEENNKVEWAIPIR